VAGRHIMVVLFAKAAMRGPTQATQQKLVQTHRTPACSAQHHMQPRRAHQLRERQRNRMVVAVAGIPLVADTPVDMAVENPNISKLMAAE